MKKTTIGVAWLWITALIIDALVWRFFYYGFRVTSLIWTLPFIGLAIVPAISLLRGKVNGWRALLLLNLFHIVTPLAAVVLFPSAGRQHLMTILPIALVSVVCLIGLLSDRPKYWREQKSPTGTSIVDVLTLLVMAISLVVVAVLILGLLIGGIDYIFTFLRGRIVL